MAPDVIRDESVGTIRAYDYDPIPVHQSGKD